MARRALLSVFDKTGLVELARGLRALGFELLTSGGTAAALAEAEVAHVLVEDETGFPEMLGGRVKTLHPRVHGGILADRSKPDHVADLTAHAIVPVDLVVCNLYPFMASPSIEMIDVGGPTMVRAAAKNHAHVGVVVDPADYSAVLDELIANEGALTDDTRRRLARAAFAHTAAYDAAIVTWLDGDELLSDSLHLALDRAQVLRYGENPHQEGARYRFVGDRSWWDAAEQLGGKELSYLNVYDTEAAWRLAHDLGEQPGVVIVKHANPCGSAVANDIATAYRLAHGCDPVSAFGGVVAANRPVTIAMAESLASVFTEVVVAPDFEPGAAEVLTAKKNLRVLRAPAPLGDPIDVKSVDGGLLVQQLDDVRSDVRERTGWKVVTSHQPTEVQWRDLAFAWMVCAHVKSNAIVLAADGQAVGVGAGQQSRVDAARIAVTKADGRARGGVCASDAFFPFRDGLDVVAEGGVKAVIQPGGSVRDDEVIAAAEELGIAMVFTGVRHFRH